MPIRRILQRDHSFGPDEIEVLIAAFEDTLRRLRLAQREDAATLTVARLIVETCELVPMQTAPPLTHTSPPWPASPQERGRAV